MSRRRATIDADVANRVEAIERALVETPPARPAEFSTNPELIEKLWKIRKGLFPAVGAVRPPGTTVIIEDVAVPIDKLAAATADLQAALVKHGYPEAIIFGHALDGNLHFVFAQGFADQEAIERYARLMDEVADIIVRRYDGSLKAEHGTGRNMAPFVELEWGEQATELMRRIKQLFDPRGLINPGVILNSDKTIHLKNIKPMAAADPLIDRCIECGFCEPLCPTRGLTVTPRQRIVGARELARLADSAEPAQGRRALERAFLDVSIDTCAACGLCETACPVGINTGALSKAIRSRHQGPIAQRAAAFIGAHYAAATSGVRAGLRLATAFDAATAGRGLDSLGAMTRFATKGATPLISRAATPRAGANPSVEPKEPNATRPRVVCFASCAGRMFGPARGDDAGEPLHKTLDRLLTKAGFAVVRAKRQPDLCCGQPFDSKGFFAEAERKANKTIEALADASEDGRWPIMIDTSPCSQRLKASRRASTETARHCRGPARPRFAEPRDPGAGERTHCAAHDLFHAAHGAGGQTSRTRERLRRKGGRPDERRLLRLRGRQRLHQAGNERPRAARARPRNLRLRGRIFDEQNMRDRPHDPWRRVLSLDRLLARQRLDSGLRGGKAEIMNAGSFTPCFVDALFAEVGVDTFRLLESLCRLIIDRRVRSMAHAEFVGKPGLRSSHAVSAPSESRRRRNRKGGSF